MEIYLSSETEGRADSLLLPIRNMVDSLLDDIRKNEYGSALTSVGVFAIIMKEEMYDSGGYCERQYYSKVRKEADIRLRLNYKSFCNAVGGCNRVVGLLRDGDALELVDIALLLGLAHAHEETEQGDGLRLVALGCAAGEVVELGALAGGVEDGLAHLDF